MDPYTAAISDLELDQIVRSLGEAGLEDVGTKSWLGQRSMFEELNVQAAMEATAETGLRVKDALVSGGVMPLAVREMLLVELWRAEILPRMTKLTGRKLESVFQVSESFVRLEEKLNY